MSHPVSEDHAQDPSPVTLENAFAQGLQCLRGKDYIGAIESFEAVLEIDPEHAYARYLKGKAHYLMKQYDDSIDELQDAIDIVAPRHLDVKVRYFTGTHLFWHPANCTGLAFAARYQPFLHGAIQSVSC
jgi:tetratricopeptide (TPR) repeat protein